MSAEKIQPHKILLLNPPADGRFVRDYYCSFSSKAGYCWPPQDLVLMSGTLGRHFAVEYRDASETGWGRKADALAAEIAAAGYQGIIFATGPATLAHDLAFVRRLKELQPQVKLLASGAFLKFAAPRLMLEYPELDGCLMDIDGMDAVHFLSGRYSAIRNMVFREQPQARLREQRNALPGHLAVEQPLHALFLKSGQRMPLPVFAGGRFVTTAASVGCGFHCSFCLASSVPCRRRDAGHVLAEIDSVLDLGVKNFFFADCHFTVDRPWLAEFCRGAQARGISWICNSRVEPLADGTLVRRLKESGCRMLMIGVESGDSAVRARYRKGISPGALRAAFFNCRKHRIMTLAYLILGLPGEDRDSLEMTRRMLRRLDADFISISFAMPDFGTPLRAASISEGLCGDTLGGWDHSRDPFIVPRGLTAAELVRFRERLYREFYLTPSRLLRLACSLAVADIRGGMKLLRN